MGTTYRTLWGQPIDNVSNLQSDWALATCSANYRSLHNPPIKVLIKTMPRGLQGILDGLAGLSDNELQLADTAEQVYVSGLALLKMLKHGRAGVPMEVMGLMLGEFVNDYAIRVVDVFSMPQSGNSVSVEAVDPAYQAEMLEMLRRVGRPEMVVGWYHSHPGFGCWFSGTDVNTQQSFEQLNSRAVGVVVDPIQSVKGKVVIDCFRLINPHLLMTGQEPRQTTSNLAHLNPPTITALVHGLNRHYYSLNTNFRKSDAEQHMLTNLGRPKWCDKLQLGDFKLQAQDDEAFMAGLKDLTAKYKTNVGEELTASAEQLLIKRVGKIDPVKRLALETESHIRSSLLKNLSALACTLVF